MGSGKKVFYQGTSMVAVPFSKGRETVADIVNGPTYKRAPFKIEHNQPTPASRNTECFSEDSLQMNPANMKEYNPAAPNGSYDLTKPTSKGHASSVACVRSPPRCPLLPSWQLHSRLGSDPLRGVWVQLPRSRHAEGNVLQDLERAGQRHAGGLPRLPGARLHVQLQHHVRRRQVHAQQTILVGAARALFPWRARGARLLVCQ